MIWKKISQANATQMKFYNCHNRGGFDIDGVMDEKELKFNA